MSDSKKVKQQIQQQNDDVYGDETYAGSSPRPDADDDIEMVIGNTMGEDAVEDIAGHKPFNVADEIEGDEDAILSDPPGDTSGYSEDDSDEDDEEEDSEPGADPLSRFEVPEETVSEE
jgi:hypothetical protein